MVDGFDVGVENCVSGTFLKVTQPVEPASRALQLGARWMADTDNEKGPPVPDNFEKIAVRTQPRLRIWKTK